MASGYRLSSIARWMNASPSAFNGTSTTYIAMLDDADWSVPDRAWRSVMRVQYSTGRVHVYSVALTQAELLAKYDSQKHGSGINSL